MVGRTLGAVLGDRFDRLRERHESDVKGTAKRTLADPRVYEHGRRSASPIRKPPRTVATS